MEPYQLAHEIDPLIGSVGAAFYFLPETLARGRAIGLDGLRFYFLGRGGVLGDVEYQVVQSAFGYFAPAVVAKMWNTGRERTSLPPRQVGRLYLDCCRDLGRRLFAEVDSLEPMCEAAEALIASTNPAGLALYAAISAEPLPDDLPGRALQLAAVLRELRGSVHLASVVAHDVAPRVAHYFRRPDDFATFGYTDAEKPDLSDELRAAMDAVDRMTNRIMAGAYGTLSSEQRAALAAGVRGLAAAAGSRH